MERPDLEVLLREARGLLGDYITAGGEVDEKDADLLARIDDALA